MANATTSCEGVDDRPPVSFFPPLYEQRRMWVLDILRREQVSSLLDVGCGQGELLSCLSQPAFVLAPHPEAEERYLPLDDDLPDLHLRELHGLDCLADVLSSAVEGTRFIQDEDSTSMDSNYCYAPRVMPRWESLDVRIWQGGLETYNAAFHGVECITAMEVIEHLPLDILPSFAPMLLGRYKPQLLLLTTPNYAFNARFEPPYGLDNPCSSSIRSGAFLDPTGRTTRVFRHADHKFEWTPEEFAQWCNEAAQHWGYHVEISGIGRPREQDPWGRDAECGRATHVAVFRRMCDQYPRKLSPPPSLHFQTHSLLATHCHPAHPRTRRPLLLPGILDTDTAPAISTIDCDGILRVVEDAMRAEHFREATVGELWRIRNVAVACGGWVEVLLIALDTVTGSPMQGHEKRASRASQLISYREVKPDAVIASASSGIEQSEHATSGSVLSRWYWIVEYIGDEIWEMHRNPWEEAAGESPSRGDAHVDLPLSSEWSDGDAVHVKNHANAYNEEDLNSWDDTVNGSGDYHGMQGEWNNRDTQTTIGGWPDEGDESRDDGVNDHSVWSLGANIGASWGQSSYLSTGRGSQE